VHAGACLLDIGEIADSGVVLLEEFHLANGVRLEEPIGDRRVVRALEKGQLRRRRECG